MARFIAKRLATGLGLCLGITLIAFVVTHTIPADPVAANLGQRAVDDPAAVASFRARNGLDRALPVQYGLYVGRLLRGDFGVSQQSHHGVATDLAEYVPATMELALFAIVVTIVVGVVGGIIAAMTRDRWPDQVLRVVSLVGVSTPAFWLALIAFYVISFRLGWLPGSGRLDPGQSAPTSLTGMFTFDALVHGQWATLWSALRHLLLPGLVLATYTIGLIMRFTRASMLEVLGNDYIRAARAKGLPERTVVLRHVLRPALIGIVTMSGLAFGSLLSGAVLVEKVFSWPGIGQYSYKSATTLDLPAIMGVTIVIAATYILINIIVDVLYTVIDPRIRLS